MRFLYKKKIRMSITEKAVHQNSIGKLKYCGKCWLFSDTFHRRFDVFIHTAKMCIYIYASDAYMCLRIFRWLLWQRVIYTDST